MGTRGPSANDRLRTIWSSEMDQYFIGLMLEQINKGNLIDGNLFSKWAWIDMMSSFNEKFKFQYEKDILKNRHKVLRNLYRAVEKLLDHEGFSWDDYLQMVVADNKVWDDYIKVHPDARSLRIKTIPYYKDLCVIYKKVTDLRNSSPRNQNSEISGGISVSETSKSLQGSVSPNEYVSDFGENTSSGNGNIINEDNINFISQFSDNVTPWSEVDTDSKVVRTRTIWQPPMDQFFIDLLVDYVHKGNQNNGLFSKQVWMKMADLFNAKFGCKYGFEILKNRFKSLRRLYKVVKNLLDSDGFSWDDTRQMVAADDSVWQAYTNAHPTARQYMARPVPYYKDLCIIYRDTTSNIRDNHPSHNLTDAPGMKVFSPFRGTNFPEPSDSSEDQVDDLTESDIREYTQRDEGNFGNPRAKRARSSDEFDLTLVSVEKVVEAIQALPEMDEELILDACDFLEDEKKARTFLALDFKLRKKWLLRKLRP